MELRHLRYFLAVAHHRNFTRAAEELHLAQPPLSQQIQQLERELKVVLFDRSGRQIELTQAGEVLLQHCLRVFESIDDMLTEVGEVAGGHKGTVVLGTHPSSAGLLLPAIIQQMRQRLPEVGLILREASTSTIVELVIQRHVDLGLARLPLLKDDPRIDLIDMHPLYQERALVVVPSDHRFTRQTGGVRIVELRDEPFLLRGGSTFYQQVMSACKQAGFTPRVICEGAETDTLLRLVAGGVGISIVPEYGLKLMSHLQASLVGIPIEREPEQESLTTTLGLVWRRGRYRSQTVRLVEDIIKEVVQSSLLFKEDIS